MSFWPGILLKGYNLPKRRHSLVVRYKSKYATLRTSGCMNLNMQLLGLDVYKCFIIGECHLNCSVKMTRTAPFEEWLSMVCYKGRTFWQCTIIPLYVTTACIHRPIHVPLFQFILHTWSSNLKSYSQKPLVQILLGWSSIFYVIFSDFVNRKFCMGVGSQLHE